MNWGKILFTEFLFIGGVGIALGLVRAPRFLMRRKLSSKSPWGYYADQVPQADAGYFKNNKEDFLHDTGTEFGGLEGFGEYGEFSGFGELGEYGGNFFGDGGGSGDGSF
jgi:hypothetical protein